MWPRWNGWNLPMNIPVLYLFIITTQPKGGAS
jgi:hypothetical protein